MNNVQAIKFVEKVIAKGSRISQHNVFDYLPKKINEKVDKMSKSFGMSRSGALYLVLTNTPRPTCKSCGAKLELTLWPRRLDHIRRYCSSLCAGKNPDTDRLRQATTLKRYGVTHVQKLKSIRAKFTRSMLRNHGVTGTAASSSLRKKMSKTLMRTHGVAHPSQSKDVLAKTRATWRRNWGADYPQQSRKFFEQHTNNFGGLLKWKRISIDDKKFTCLGYEPEALRLLFDSGVPVRYLLTRAAEGIPSIPYTEANKNRVYHPDIYARFEGEWVVFEVKSTYTLGLSRDKRFPWQRVKTKLKATATAGYTPKLIVVSKRKNKTIAFIIDDPHEMTRSEIRREVNLHLR